jgi:hypothetical protein
MLSWQLVAALMVALMAALMAAQMLRYGSSFYDFKAHLVAHHMAALPRMAVTHLAHNEGYSSPFLGM